ncbi:MAG: exopolysaccharide biosynthesis polyprenyl glycosylphosphotransferase [Croceibacterium sp.]
MNISVRQLPVGTVLPRAPVGGMAPSLERKRLRLYLIQMAADVMLLLGSFYGAGMLYFNGTPPGHPFLAGQLMLPLFLSIALHNASYSLGSLTDWRNATGKMAVAMFIAAALLNFLAFFVKLNALFSRVVFVAGLSAALVLMAASRWLMGRWVRRQWGPNPRNVLQIDAGGPALTIPYAFHVDAAEHGLFPSLDDPHALDRLARYVRNMDQVIVNCPMEMRIAWAGALKGCGVHGEVTSEGLQDLRPLGIERHGEVLTLLVSTGPLGMRARASKRLFDIAVSLLALALFSPVIVVAALLIKLEDGGPVLFRQRRLGQGNRFFSIYKLRTMRVENADAEGHRSTGRADSRMTRLGAFLRRTSIDELPQLFNVLRGEMSIVGPRPHALGSQAGDKLFWQVDVRYWQRHTLRPGITGLAQIRGFRGATDTETDLSSRLQADLEYLAGWSIWRDVRIIFATIRVLSHERAF